ncbi:MAG: serine/threonine protein kinase, partial [Candidatus Xenobia bacterium]
EFIEGEAFDTLLEEYLTLSGQPVPLKMVVECGIQVCNILAYLHSLPRPVIHRDIKPGNLILRKARSEVVLVDFGLARSVNLMSQSTKTMVGTLGYAPLEQVKGHADTRSDLFALGATMHHLICGHIPVPFNLPPLASVAQVPPELSETIDRAVAEMPDARFQKAEELREALQRVLEILDPKLKPAPSPVPNTAEMPGVPRPQPPVPDTAVMPGGPREQPRVPETAIMPGGPRSPVPAPAPPRPTAPAPRATLVQPVVWRALGAAAVTMALLMMWPRSHPAPLTPPPPPPPSPSATPLAVATPFPINLTGLVATSQESQPAATPPPVASPTAEPPPEASASPSASASSAPTPKPLTQEEIERHARRQALLPFYLFNKPDLAPPQWLCDQLSGAAPQPDDVLPLAGTGSAHYISKRGIVSPAGMRFTVAAGDKSVPPFLLYFGNYGVLFQPGEDRPIHIASVSSDPDPANMAGCRPLDIYYDSRAEGWAYTLPDSTFSLDIGQDTGAQGQPLISLTIKRGDMTLLSETAVMSERWMGNQVGVKLFSAPSGSLLRLCGFSLH